jgi:hypothetical protein
MSDLSIIERALQLVESGECKDVAGVEKQLSRAALPPPEEGIKLAVT